MTRGSDVQPQSSGDKVMSWETPAFADVRFGFEVTMYISNR
jgi:coenzyme PQQ precursor peptide PqqA